jgi:hypothetical protein
MTLPWQPDLGDTVVKLKRTPRHDAGLHLVSVAAFVVEDVSLALI